MVTSSLVLLKQVSIQNNCLKGTNKAGKAGKCAANILNSNLFIMYEALMFCCDVRRCFLQSKSESKQQHPYACKLRVEINS